MATELGCLNGIIDREDVAEFFELFDRTMRREEPFYAENYKSFEDTDHKFDFNDDKVGFHVDIYGFFNNPYETPLREIIINFAKKNPAAELKLDYDLKWDDSGDMYFESYILSQGKLKYASLLLDEESFDLYQDNEAGIMVYSVDDYKKKMKYKTMKIK